MDERQDAPGSERRAWVVAGLDAGPSRLAASAHRAIRSPPTDHAGGETTSTSRCPAPKRRPPTGGGRRRVGPRGWGWCQAPVSGQGAGAGEVAWRAAAAAAERRGRYCAAASDLISLLHADGGLQHPAQGERTAVQAVEAGPQPRQPGPEPRAFAREPGCASAPGRTGRAAEAGGMWQEPPYCHGARWAAPCTRQAAGGPAPTAHAASSLRRRGGERGRRCGGGHPSRGRSGRGAGGGRCCEGPPAPSACRRSHHAC